MAIMRYGAIFRVPSRTHLSDENTRKEAIARTERDARHSSLTRRMHVCTKGKPTDISTKYPEGAPFRIRWKNNGLDGHHK